MATGQQFVKRSPVYPLNPLCIPEQRKSGKSVIPYITDTGQGTQSVIKKITTRISEKVSKNQGALNGWLYVMAPGIERGCRVGGAGTGRAVKSMLTFSPPVTPAGRLVSRDAGIAPSSRQACRGGVIWWFGSPDASWGILERFAKSCESGQLVAWTPQQVAYSSIT